MQIYLDTSRRDNKILKVGSARFETGGSVFKLLVRKVKDPHSIKKADFNPGPGDSFTGLKVGASIVNATNYALGKIKPNEIKLPRYGRGPIPPYA